MKSNVAERVRTALASTTFVLGGVALGFVLGGLAGRLSSNSAMGWDQLADVLGGVSIGMALGAVVTIGLGRRLSVRRRIRFGVLMLIVAALSLAGLRYLRTSAADPAPADGSTPSPPTTVVPNESPGAG